MSVNEESFLEDLASRSAQARKNASLACEEWQKGVDALVALFPEAASGAEKQAAEFGAALGRYHEKLDRPVLRIAAIGTTSSAKSTLLNFLAGASLLPTAVQEKSAGSVRIIHAPEPALHIADTAGRLWECGDIEVSGPDEIREALEVVMDAYRDAVREGSELEAPGFVVRHPLSLPAFLNLPESYQIELMDLPGLKYTGDFRNRQVIARCRDALCLVTYGSQETDPVKQEVLLDDAFAQIRAIGSPVSRMLFVATRVDEFLLRTPESWPDNEREFLEDRLNAIREKMAETFPGQGAERISMTAISPLPAFYAMQLFDPGQRERAWKKIKSSFLGLVEGGRDGDPEKGVDLEVDLKPAYRLWDDQDWGIIAAQLEETTHAADFIDALKKHIRENFASIVLPPAGAEFLEDADNAQQWLAAELEFARNTIAQDYDNQKKRLELAVQKLDEINKKAQAGLERFLNEWLEAVFRKDSVQEKRNALEGLRDKYPGFMEQKLAMLAGWSERLAKASEKPATCVVDRIVKNIPFPQDLPERASLEKWCSALRRYGYNGQTALNGLFRICSEDREAPKFSALAEAYNKLVETCRKSAVKNLEAGLLFQTDRMLEALNDLQDSYLAHLDSQYNQDIPAEFREVTRITPNALIKFAESFNLAAPVRMDREARITVRQVDAVQEVENRSDTGIPPLDSVVDLWRRIWGNDKLQKIISILQRQISIPPVRNLVLDAEKFHNGNAAAINRQIAAFAEGQMNTFLENIRQYQQMRLNAYREKLDAVVREKNLNRQASEARLEAAGEKLASSIRCAGLVRGASE